MSFYIWKPGPLALKRFHHRAFAEQRADTEGSAVEPPFSIITDLQMLHRCKDLKGRGSQVACLHGPHKVSELVHWSRRNPHCPQSESSLGERVTCPELALFRSPPPGDSSLEGLRDGYLDSSKKALIHLGAQGFGPIARPIP